jgi:hypothetical protein
MQNRSGAVMKTAVMKTQVQRARKAAPYSAPLCVLMLLLAGMLVKFGPTLQFFHGH